MITQRRAAFRTILLAALIIFFGASLASKPGPVSAQARRTRTPTSTSTRTATPTLVPSPTLPLADWPPPLLLFTSRGAMHTPVLAADQEGRLHLFWKLIEPANELGEPGEAILYYSQKTRRGWSSPVAIFASSAINNPTAAVDSYGVLHLMWSGENQRLHYSRVQVDKADDVHSWSKPVLFEPANLSPHLVIDRRDVLHVVFPGRQAKGIYYMTSSDGGDHWSAAVNVSPTDRVNTSADYPRIAVSPNGTIHIVWTEFQLPSGWPPTGIYYIRSEDGGKHWSQKVQFTGPNYDQANIVAPSDSVVHVVWNAIVTIQGRYHRWSNDGGRTWSKPAQISSLGGTEGPPQIAADTFGKVHLLSTYDGCPNYHYFVNGRWSGPVCLVNQSGPIEDIGWSGYVEEPAFAISNGKYLHAVYWDDRRRLWYSGFELDHLPEIRPVPFITRRPPAPTLTQTPAATPTAQKTSTPLPAFQGEISSPNPLRSLITDLLPAFLVIILGSGAAVLWRARQTNALRSRRWKK